MNSAPPPKKQTNKTKQTNKNKNNGSLSIGRLFGLILGICPIKALMYLERYIIDGMTLQEIITSDSIWGDSCLQRSNDEIRNHFTYQTTR